MHETKECKIALLVEKNVRKRITHSKNKHYNKYKLNCFAAKFKQNVFLNCLLSTMYVAMY